MIILYPVITTDNSVRSNWLLEGLLAGYQCKARERVCSTGLERHPPQKEGEVSCKFISYHQLTNKSVECFVPQSFKNFK